MPTRAPRLFYYQTNTLRFSPQFIGSLAAVGGGCGILGALAYGHLCSSLPLRRLIAIGIGVHAAAVLRYLAYRSPATALLITGTAGLVGTFAVLSLLDLAARATPAGGEALGYALIVSVGNIAGALSAVTGSWLYGHFHLTFINLVWLNAGTGALVLLFVPFLPSSLVEQNDGGTRDRGSKERP